MSPLRHWIFLSALLVAPAALAQTPPQPVRGQVVLVEHRCSVRNAQVVACDADRRPSTASGQLETSDGDTLRISVPGRAPLAFPTIFVNRLFVMHGKGGHFWAGAGLGLLAGIGVGTMLFSNQEQATCQFPGCDPGAFGDKSFVPLLLGPPFGLVIGGAVGGSIGAARWRAVPFRDLRVGVRPGRESVRIGLSLAF